MLWKEFAETATAKGSIVTVSPIDSAAGYVIEAVTPTGTVPLERWTGGIRLFKTLNAAASALEEMGIVEAKLITRPRGTQL